MDHHKHDYGYGNWFLQQPLELRKGKERKGFEASIIAAL
jgi:hypothetical protein